MRFDGPPLRMTPALRARVRELEEQALGMLKRRRRRPTREAWERAFGPALEVRIVVDRERVGWVATVPKMKVECVADAYTDAISRAALAVLTSVADAIMANKRKPPASITFEVVRRRPRFVTVDPRTPEERKIDEEVYRLCEAGKFFSGFKPPQPRKRTVRERTPRKRTRARRSR
jgi:hypothetical protein